MNEELLHKAVTVMAGRCDQARALDHIGYNKLDTSFGHWLAERPFSTWSPKHKRSAWRMLAKYRGQLEKAGIDYGSIPEPPEISAEANPKSIWIKNGQIHIAFPYGRNREFQLLLIAVKQLPQTQWRGGPTWTMPALPANAIAALDFGRREGFDITADLRELAEKPQVLPVSLPRDFVFSDAGKKEIKLTDKWIEVRWPFNGGNDSFAIYSLVEKIPGRSFRKSNNDPRWLIPRTPVGLIGAANVLANTKGFVGDVEKILELGAKEQVLVEATIAASKAAIADLTIEGFGKEPRPFQKAGIVYCLDKKRVILGDEMGLGKTIEALATIQKANAYPALAIVPANLRLNWIKEARECLPGKHLQMLAGKDTFGRINADITVMSYNMLGDYRDMLNLRGFKAVIADECHMLKNEKALRTRYTEEIFNRCVFQPDAEGKIDRRRRINFGDAPEYQLMLSGTPILNRPNEFIAQLRIINRLEELGGHHYFTKHYCGAYQTRHGMNTEGADNLLDLNERLRATCYVRRLKSEVLKELPPKQRVVIPIEISNWAEYQRAEEDLIAWLRETKGADTADRALRAQQLVRIEALKQLAARGKMAGIKEWVSNFQDSGEKLVTFAWHKEMVREFAAEFHAPMIYGDTSHGERDRIVERFQADPELKNVVCNLQTIGITLTAASNVAFCELGWNPATMDQAGDRCHRIGQTDSVTEWWFIGRGTIDEPIQELIEEKRTIVGQATDGIAATGDLSVMNELVKRLTGGRKSNETIEPDQGRDSKHHNLSLFS